MKEKIVIIGILLILIIATTPSVFSGDTDDINVTLNPQATASITVNQASWSPSCSLGETEQTSGTWATLTNDGDVQVDVTIKANNTNDWTLGTVGHDQFKLGWLVQGSVQKYEYNSPARADPAWANPQTQTFTIGADGPNEDFYCTKAVVMLRRNGAASAATASILDGGTTLASATLVSGVVTSDYDVWYTFNFPTPCYLLHNHQYALQVSSGGSIEWWYGPNDGYTGGTGYNGHDFLFQTWGYNSTVTNITTSPLSFASNLPPVGSDTKQFGLKIEMPTSSSTNQNQTTEITFIATAD